MELAKFELFPITDRISRIGIIRFHYNPLAELRELVKLRSRENDGKIFIVEFPRIYSWNLRHVYDIALSFQQALVLHKNAPECKPKLHLARRGMDHVSAGVVR